jgi:tetratricopeptide (TPR) repeat protein
MTDEQFSEANHKLKCGADRKIAEIYEKAGEWDKAKSVYEGLYANGLCSTGGWQWTGEVLWNLAICAEKSSDLESAIRWREELVSKHPDAEQAVWAQPVLAENYQTLGMFQEAASWYEKYAYKFVGAQDAPEALLQALKIRLALGDLDQALKNSKQFIKHYEAGFMKRPEIIPEIRLSMGRIYEKQGVWDKAIKHYKKFKKKYCTSKTFDYCVRAHLQIAHVWEKKKKSKKALASYKDAKNAYSSLYAKKLEQEDPDRGQLLREAIAEVVFRLGEAKLEKFEDIEIEDFDPDKVEATASGLIEAVKWIDKRGKKSYPTDSVKAEVSITTLAKLITWSNTDLPEWLGAKRTAIMEAEALFERSLEMEVAPWSIASLARTGDMYLELFDRLMSLPFPTWDYPQQKLKAELWEQYLVSATENYYLCLDLSERLQSWDEWSVHCESALNTINPSKYPVSSEIVLTDTGAEVQLAWPGIAK